MYTIICCTDSLNQVGMGRNLNNTIFMKYQLCVYKHFTFHEDDGCVDKVNYLVSR